MSAASEVEKLSQVVLGSLEDDANAGQLARRAYRSRAQFFRVFGALIEETPAAMRRRLLLERAAWQLGRTEQSITEVAFDARYGSLEAFTRAFRRAFKISPSLYRRMGATHCHLPAPNAIHFCAPASASEGETMDLYDRILTDVRNRNAWSDTFVDALCEPPETFSFAGMFAHVITFNAYQRLLALDVLRRLGVKVEGFGCPTEYEASVAPTR